MYEESKVKFNWKGFFLKLIIVLLIIFLIIKLLPLNSKKESNGHTKIFNDNFASMKTVGNDYFKKDNLPTDDKEVKLTLRQLINSKKIKTLKGADKKVCNEDSSYIKSYKKNIGYELEVHLVCGNEEDTSYIYLGCFDKCEVKPTSTTTTKTTTTKKSNNNNNKKSNNNSSNNNKSNSNSNNTKKTTTTTTTTTRIKKYAVIFNANGGNKFNTLYVVEGKTATNPGVPTKEGYTFVGWYLDGKEYDFNTPVTKNIILIAKWKVNDLIGINDSKSLYNEIVYSVASANINSKSAVNKDFLKVPQSLEGKSNVRIKSVSYIRNIMSNDDITNYLNNKNNTFTNQEVVVNNTNTISNFGTLDNIELVKNSDNTVNWNGTVKNVCSSNINNNSLYGIIYLVVWEYNN